MSLRRRFHVLYLIFNEGYAASSGEAHQRTDLSSEAIRLVRAAHELLPESGEVSGLLALMLLTDARRPARSGPDGEIVPLDEGGGHCADRQSLQGVCAFANHDWTSMQLDVADVPPLPPACAPALPPVDVPPAPAVPRQVHFEGA